VFVVKGKMSQEGMVVSPCKRAAARKKNKKQTHSKVQESKTEPGEASMLDPNPTSRNRQVFEGGKRSKGAS